MMPFPEKKRKRHSYAEMAANDDDFVASFDDLGVDVLANILAFLSLKDIMSKRRINKKSMEAVKKTIVPPTDFRVGNVDDYNAMNVMTRAMPNLQQITIGCLGNGSLGYGTTKWSDGEGPDEGYAARTIHNTTHDIGTVSNFNKLRGLTISAAELLNGRYPALFNFPLLQKLNIKYSPYLKWDLEMLVGLPSLKELDCVNNYCLTGNINSLRVLKDTLEKVTITYCSRVEGSFMDLADFPNLKKLDLFGTAVTGDIRGISENDFPSLEYLDLPKRICYGGKAHEFQRISDAPDVARAVYLFKKQRPALKYYWFGILSDDSPERYRSVQDIPVRNERENCLDSPPFRIEFVQAGSRIGYRWQTYNGNPCEVNWLDPEPDRESSEYAKYIEEMQRIEEQKLRYYGMYRGFHRPPTEEEYIRLYEEYVVSNPERWYY